MKISIFQKMSDICAKILSKNINFDEQESNDFQKVAFLKRGHSYGESILLTNKVLIRSFTGVAKEDTVVYYLPREMFTEAIAMGLNESNPKILNVTPHLTTLAVQILAYLQQPQRCYHPEEYLQIQKNGFEVQGRADQGIGACQTLLRHPFWNSLGKNEA